MNQEIIAKAGEIIAANTAHGALPDMPPFCVLALIDSNGYPTASTITAAKSDGIRSLTFCTGLTSNKPSRINNSNRASVCFANALYNITLVGTIEIVTAAPVKEEMWYDALKQHFSGADDPNYCVLKFTTERYNLFIDWKEEAGTL